MVVGEADRKNVEEEKEEVDAITASNTEMDFIITDTEDSRLFRKFLITWDSYFNKSKEEVLVATKTNLNTARKKRRNRK